MGGVSETRLALLGHRLLIVPLEDMVELVSIEIILQFTNLLPIILHLHVLAGGLLHHLVDDQLRVPSNEEALCSELGSCSNSVEEHFVFCNVVSSPEMELKEVPQFVTARGT